MIRKSLRAKKKTFVFSIPIFSVRPYFFPSKLALILVFRISISEISFDAKPALGSHPEETAPLPGIYHWGILIGN